MTKMVWDIVGATVGVIVLLFIYSHYRAWLS